ncbi:hypothetical protein ZWY2020_038275 [Hordeum vulgare]|nr:hypothetical protein ZWY2020_038275 [Hordeum vulgare]
MGSVARRREARRALSGGRGDHRRHGPYVRVQWRPSAGTSYLLLPADPVPPSRIRDPPWPLPARSRPRRPSASTRATPRSSPSRRSTGRAASGYDVGEPGMEVSVYASTSSLRAEVNESPSALAIDALSQVKHVLLPITDRNPYLSEGTRQAAATTTSLAKKYGASITVPKESSPEHDTQMSSIRWHLSEGSDEDVYAWVAANYALGTLGM